MSEEQEKTGKAAEGGEGEPREPEGLDVFDHVPEAIALRESRSPSEQPPPGAEAVGAEPSEEEPVAEEPTEEEGEEAGAEEETEEGAEIKAGEEEIPEEQRIPEEKPPWFDKAVQQVREEVKAEYEPIVKERDVLKTEQGRQRKEEEDSLRAEAEEQQRKATETYDQAATGVGSQFVNLVRILGNSTMDEKGNISWADDQGVTRNMTLRDVGHFLLGSSGYAQSLNQNWQQGMSRISTKIEQRLFSRRPDLEKYKPKFNAKVEHLGHDLATVNANPRLVEAIYDILENDDKLANFPKIKDEAKAAAKAEMLRKKKAMSPGSSGGSKGKTAPSTEQKEKQAAESSLGGLTTQRKESRAHIF